MTVKLSDVSVVLQGPVRFETPESVESVRRLLPEAELILSTWEDEDVSSLGPIRVLRSEKPSAPIQHDRLSVPNNLNRLIRSTKKGVAAVTRPYVLKMRSDMVLDSLAFLDSFERFPERGPMPLFAHKVLVPALFSRTAYRGHAVPFHLSDWAVFGLAQDVRALFSELPEVVEPEFTRWFERQDHKSPFGTTLFRVAPEQYVAYSFFSRSTGRTLMVDASDNNPAIVLEAEKFTVSNYIVAEYCDSGLRLPKYPASIDEKLIGMEFFELWNRFTYEQAYRKYCDPHYEITALEEAELYRRRPLNEARLRLAKHLRRLTQPASLSRIPEELLALPVVCCQYLRALFSLRANQ